MRILLVSDAWFPQVNGVVRTLSTVAAELGRAGHEVRVVSPAGFRTVACPTYPEIRLALAPRRGIARELDAFAPDAIHVATEGPLGFAARAECRARALPFTTSLHTRFPEYIHARCRLPVAWSWRGMRWFHDAAERTMVATASLHAELVARGFRHPVRWSRGVDTELFRPRPGLDLGLPRPLHLYVGRVAPEKNLSAFLGLDLPGTKLVVGDGPELDALRARHRDAVFLGARQGEELARLYSAADVFVFPSRTDTFGLVLLEALASGVPVAAFPVPGPLDVVTSPAVGALDEDLGRAVARARGLDRAACRAFAQRFTWARCAEQFAGLLAPVDPVSRPSRVRRWLELERV